MSMKLCRNGNDKENPNNTKKPALVPLFTLKRKREMAQNRTLAARVLWWYCDLWHVVAQLVKALR